MLATDVLLPVCLAVIMVTLGLSLVTADFRRVAQAPRGIAIGLGNLLTHLARGEVALSVSMTALSGLDAQVSMPGVVARVFAIHDRRAGQVRRRRRRGARPQRRRYGDLVRGGPSGAAA